MATLYPGQIQTFPTMQNITADDADLVKQYQEAMENGNLQEAGNILAQISNYPNKLITADILNTMQDTLVALQVKFDQRYSPGITVSVDAPTNPGNGDYWWQVK